MKKNFLNSVKVPKLNGNVFNLSHDVKLSLNMGELVPIMCTECIPGDSFSISCESLLRFQPLVAPVMHRMDVTMHYFFVPMRLVWAGWENYITNVGIGGANPGAPTTLPAFPTIDIEDANYTPLCDYLGIPNPIGANVESVSAVPFAVYQKIFNEYYRDQNLIDEKTWNLSDGDNTSQAAQLLSMNRRAWEHDYFTSALPFAQKGDAVTIPVLQSFPDTQVYRDNSGVPDGNIDIDFVGDPSGNPGTLEVINVPSDTGILSDSLYANTSELNPGTPTTINDLRTAFRIQEWLERAARGGSRYIEMIKSMFNVNSSDKRLNRPEYITGVKSPVVISEVLNTTGTDDAPQGNMAGHGISVGTGSYGKYYCEEHGYIMGIMSVMPQTAYQQGIPKHFLKTTSPYDFFWTPFANLGEQEIYNREVYAFQGANGDNTFGYIPRYGEYRFENNRVAGDFRTTLDFWHLGRIFSTPPALTPEFINCDPTHRVFAVTDPAEQKLLAHVYNKVSAFRLIPKYGTPTF